MLKRTFVLGFILGGMIATAVVLIFEEGSRPFSTSSLILLFLVSSLPGFGFALFFDPYSKRKKEEYLTIDFYKEGD